MTSAQLLASWDKTKAVFANRTVAWLTLHRICAAGADGTNLAQMGKVAGMPSQATLEQWISGGLITKQVNERHKLSPTVTYHATPKAYKLLRVKAPPVNTAPPPPLEHIDCGSGQHYGTCQECRNPHGYVMPLTTDH